MPVVPYPPTDKSYQHIHMQVDTRPTLEPETEKLCSFMSMVPYPPIDKHINKYTHKYTPRIHNMS